jgi:3-methyladenine DNA glycosylase AlkD
MLRLEIKNAGSPERAKTSAWFFKTGKGQYGEGDVFYGIIVPVQRRLALKYKTIPLEDISTLLKSKVHEERLIALYILVAQFESRKELDRKEIYDFYLAHTKCINNWDLVDSSADKIVGAYLLRRDRTMLVTLAKSKSLWERRIAIIATYAFIKNGESEWTLKIAALLLKDKHDLIHKAVGWMLREVGKRVSQDVEEAFLSWHYKKMPRTALRYAIEKFSPEKRKAYLQGTI